MILPTTMRALQARDATVYRLEIGAYTIKAGTFAPGHPAKDVSHPPHVELFSSKAGALRLAATYDGLAPMGVPVAVVKPVKARDYCQLTLRELSADDKARIAREHATIHQRRSAAQ